MSKTVGELCGFEKRAAPAVINSVGEDLRSLLKWPGRLLDSLVGSLSRTGMKGHILGGSGIGAAVGALKSPKEEEESQRYRIRNALKGALLGGGIGYGVGALNRESDNAYYVDDWHGTETYRDLWLAAMASSLGGAGLLARKRLKDNKNKADDRLEDIK